MTLSAMPALNGPPPPDQLAPPRPCPGPHRALEAMVWAGVMDLDTAVALGRRHATRPAPTPLEAHDLVAALTSAAEALTTVTRQAAGDVAQLGVMHGHGVEGVYMAGPALEVASAVDSAAQLAEFVAGALSAAAGSLAALAQVPPWPAHDERPAVPHRPSRIIAVVGGC